MAPISDLSPSIEYPGVSIKRVERTDNPNYLFIYLDIAASAKAGSFDIKFSNDTDMILIVTLCCTKTRTLHTQKAIQTLIRFT